MAARSRYLILILAMMILGTALCSWGQVLISVQIAPPALPVYAQPLCPGPGYIWTPGYWAWGSDGYYWVPGTWVLGPQPGFFWTPGYWGFADGLYIWHAGYWGPVVGFYGGINYGFGYTGSGYYGGHWRGNDFYYNRAVNNVNITNVNVYNRTVTNNVNVTRVSYNGGPGGVQARPTQAQLAAEHQRHEPPTSAQVQHQQTARNDRAQLASVDHGRPAVFATPRPGAFTAHETSRANTPAANRVEPTPRTGNVKAGQPQTRPPEKNNQQSRTRETSPANPTARPKEKTTEQARTRENTPARSVPQPPEHNEQQARTSAAAPHPQQSARQKPGQEPQQGPLHAHNLPPSRPGTAVNGRPTAPPETRNVPHPNAERSTASPRAESKPEAKPNNPHQADNRGAPHPETGPRPSSPPAHEAQPPRENAHPPAAKEKEQERPH